MEKHGGFSNNKIINQCLSHGDVIKEWQDLYEKGELNTTQSFFFESRAPEQLFDVEADPYETKNLATDPAFIDKLLELRLNLESKVKNMPDLSFYPEFELIKV